MWSSKRLVFLSIVVSLTVIRFYNAQTFQCDESIHNCKIVCLSDNIENGIKLECSVLPRFNNSLLEIFNYNLKLVELQIRNSDLREIKHFANVELQDLISMSFFASNIDPEALSEILMSTPNLKHLILEEENLQKVKRTNFPEGFGETLETLVLNNDNINEIEVSAFESFKGTLKQLELRENKLVKIPEAIKEFEVLELLDLSNNKIRSVLNEGVNTLKTLDTLKTLRMNDLECKCEIKKSSFFKWVVQKKNLDVECASPKKLQSKKLDHLTEKDLCGSAGSVNAMATLVVSVLIGVKLLN
ncbi:uncharacterized protein LOC143222914 [Tachypleus tridentatus]|uniref:uncharacterized protein LOC143222914 n=1 Tax=Tachypleus tridentatus TaxID=6853 RepID=UPI003FD56CC6